MNGTVGFILAVGGVSLICYWLIGRADRISDRRRAYADNSGSDSGSVSSSIGGFSLRDWFGASSSSSENSCASSDSLSSGSWSDSSSSSDSGGGDGGGGGGGD